jgi:hypothetical protein
VSSKNTTGRTVTGSAAVEQLLFDLILGTARRERFGGLLLDLLTEPTVVRSDFAGQGARH